MEMDRYPGDSVEDIFNEKFAEWNVGVKMDTAYNIDKV